MDYSAPAGHIAYESDPARAAQLLQSGGDYLDVRRPGFPESAIAVSRPRCWVRLASLLQGRETVRGGIYTQPANAPSAILFLGKMKGPGNAAERLVVLTCEWNLSTRHLVFGGAPIEPDLESRARHILVGPRAPGGTSLTVLNNAQVLRIYAGTVDQQDASLLTVKCEVDGKEGTLRFRLTDSSISWSRLGLEESEGPAFERARAP
jgi:hypothetical protein